MPPRCVPAASPRGRYDRFLYGHRWNTPFRRKLEASQSSHPARFGREGRLLWGRGPWPRLRRLRVYCEALNIAVAKGKKSPDEDSRGPCQ